MLRLFKDEYTGEMIQSWGELVVYRVWKLCIMALESGVGPEGWKTTVITPIYKGKG